MHKKFSTKIFLLVLLAFCSGISASAMESSKTFDNNNSKVSKNNSLEIKGQKGFGTGALAASNVVSFTIGGLAGYFGAQKFSIAPIVEENNKLKSENEKLKQKENPINKDDYDKKCKEVAKLNAEIVEARNKIKDLEKKLSTPPEDTGDDPAELKETIVALKNQLKVFTDVWGDPSDNDKMNKMKALHVWRHGEKDSRSYKWLTDFAKTELHYCIPDAKLHDINYDERANQFCQGLSNTDKDNWFAGVCDYVLHNAGQAPALYNRAMGQFKAFLEDLRKSLLDT